MRRTEVEESGKRETDERLERREAGKGQRDNLLMAFDHHAGPP